MFLIIIINKYGTLEYYIFGVESGVKINLRNISEKLYPLELLAKPRFEPFVIILVHNNQNKWIDESIEGTYNHTLQNNNTKFLSYNKGALAYFVKH